MFTRPTSILSEGNAIVAIIRLVFLATGEDEGINRIHKSPFDLVSL